MTQPLAILSFVATLSFLCIKNLQKTFAWSDCIRLLKGKCTQVSLIWGSEKLMWLLLFNALEKKRMTLSTLIFSEPHNWLRA